MQEGQDSPTPIPDESPKREAPKYSNLRGVGRAMAILEVVGAGPLRAKDIATELDLKWTTAYRTLVHLEEQGYLQRDPATNEYSIGAGIFALGLAYLRGHQLLHLSQPHLETLAHDLSCVAQVNERHHQQVLTIAMSEGPSRIPNTSAGTIFPLGAAAKGRLLLAHAPADVIESTIEHPPSGLSSTVLADPDALREELATIREQGYALTLDALQPGIGSLAVPIHDREGTVCACLALVLASDRLAPDAERESILNVARHAGRRLSIGIGWSGQQA